MCEINPKRKEFFQLEFFTAHEISDERWHDLVIDRLTILEQAFNAHGVVRVHIHQIEESDGKS